MHPSKRFKTEPVSLPPAVLPTPAAQDPKLPPSENVRFGSFQISHTFHKTPPPTHGPEPVLTALNTALTRTTGTSSTSFLPSFHPDIRPIPAPVTPLEGIQASIQLGSNVTAPPPWEITQTTPLPTQSIAPFIQLEVTHRTIPETEWTQMLPLLTKVLQRGNENSQKPILEFLSTRICKQRHGWHSSKPTTPHDERLLNHLVNYYEKALFPQGIHNAISTFITLCIENRFYPGDYIVDVYLQLMTCPGTSYEEMITNVDKWRQVSKFVRIGYRSTYLEQQFLHSFPKPPDFALLKTEQTAPVSFPVAQFPKLLPSGNIQVSSSQIRYTFYNMPPPKHEPESTPTDPNTTIIRTTGTTSNPLLPPYYVCITRTPAPPTAPKFPPPQQNTPFRLPVNRRAMPDDSWQHICQSINLYCPSEEAGFIRSTFELICTDICKDQQGWRMKRVPAASEATLIQQFINHYTPIVFPCGILPFFAKILTEFQKAKRDPDTYLLDVFKVLLDQNSPLQQNTLDPQLRSTYETLLHTLTASCSQKPRSHHPKKLTFLTFPRPLTTTHASTHPGSDTLTK